MSGMCHRSRRGCGGGLTNDCLTGLKNIVAKLGCYRESFSCLAMLFSSHGTSNWLILRDRTRTNGTDAPGTINASDIASSPPRY